MIIINYFKDNFSEENMQNTLGNFKFQKELFYTSRLLTRVKLF